MCVSWAGPVRGIDFHSNQPLFVSGGDDYKIKVKCQASSIAYVLIYMYVCSKSKYTFTTATCNMLSWLPNGTVGYMCMHVIFSA